jgi:ketosteroid isomerase-like protein
MSQENVEIVRAAYRAFNVGDMDALRELYDPGAILVRGLEAWPEGEEPVVGREAIIRSFQEGREAWDADTLEMAGLIDLGDRVVVRQVWCGVGRGPAARIEWTVICTLRKGKIFLLEQFWDHDEALEALGLSDQAMSQENVDLVSSSIEVYIAGDRDAYLDFFTEDVEGRPDVSRFPEAKPFRGREEFRRFLAETDQGWEGGASVAVIREVFPVGDRVVARTDWGGRGRASGIELRSSLTSINSFREGRIAKIECFFDHAKALEALGLSE